MSTGIKIGLGSSLGAFIFASIAWWGNYAWWALGTGLFLGTVTAYLTHDLRLVGVIADKEIRQWVASGFYRFIVLSGAIVWFTIIFGTGMYFLTLVESSDGSAPEHARIMQSLLVGAVCSFVLVSLFNNLILEDCDGKSALKWNPVDWPFSLLFYIVIAILFMIRIFVREVHSEEALQSSFYACIGGTVGILAGGFAGVLIGTGTGFLLGYGSYKLINVKLLARAPA